MGTKGVIFCFTFIQKQNNFKSIIGLLFVLCCFETLDQLASDSEEAEFSI